jgi:hypothetical protein
MISILTWLGYCCVGLVLYSFLTSVPKQLKRIATALEILVALKHKEDVK